MGITPGNHGKKNAIFCGVFMGKGWDNAFFLGVFMGKGRGKQGKMMGHMMIKIMEHLREFMRST